MTTPLMLGEGWALWPDFVLRSAGFSVRGVEGLRATDLAAVADELLALEDDVRNELRAELGARPESRPARKALAMLDRSDHDVWAVARRHAPHRQPDADALRQNLAEAFDRATKQLNAELERQVNEPRFREAVTWQNYRALALMKENLRKKPRRARPAEEALVKYLQRYCTKNDTAGFFGPFQWARIEPDSKTIQLELGPELTARCRVYLEHWTVDAMAELAVATPGVRHALAPRIAPLYSLRDDALWSPMGTVTLPEPTAAVLAAVDGERSAELIAALLVGQGTFADARAVFDVLEQCAMQGWIVWGRDLPTDGSPYERHLHDQLAALDDEELREHALRPLRRLEELRDAALRARGDPDAVEAALKELDATFETFTRRSATRRGGQAYAARTLMSLQCTRDVSLTLGRAFVDALRPMTLVLQSMRWLSFHMARFYRTEAERIYRRLRDETGTAEVSLIPLMTEMARVRQTSGRTDLMRELELKWDEILGAHEGDSRIEIAFETIAARVADAFAVEGAGFPNACAHSPDVLIAAAGAEAIARGDFFVVLGEIHPFIVTLENDIFVTEHPDRPRLEAILRETFPSGRLPPAVQRGAVVRSILVPLGQNPLDVCIELPNGGRSSWPRDRTLAVSEIVVREESHGLVVRERDGTREWDPLALALGLLLKLPSTSFFDSQRRHAPRVTIDRFVLSRERWRFTAGELTFASVADPLERFVEVRRWARRLRIPRFTFYKVPSEPKPIYLDLDAPHCVSIFCKALRAESGEAGIAISEMLPTPEQCWLPDTEGNPYASELRLVVRDLAERERGPDST